MMPWAAVTNLYLQLDEIAEEFTSGQIDEPEAYERCLEAGCTPAGARIHVARWARSST